MAADTFTSALGVILMGTGNDNNAWGSNLNTSALQILEDAIANTSPQAVTGGTLDLSTTPPPAGPSLARYRAFAFTGTLTSAQSIKVPNLNKWWMVSNQTSGAFALTFKTPSGSASTAIPQNSGWQVVFCDGANNIVVFPFNTKQIQMPDGSAAAPPYSDVNETNSGWYRNGTQDWRLSVNGVDVLQVTGTGAGTPSVLNLPSPMSLSFAGTPFNQAAVVPSGAEMAYAGLTAPSGWLFEFGQAISRATFATLFTAITLTTTGTPSNGSSTVASVATNLVGMGVEGALIEGAGIPTGTTIFSVTSNSIVMSQNATGGSAGEALRILPYGQGDASTTFNVPDRRGRVIAGRDNMGGTAAGRLTGQTNGILGTLLNATGGEETHTLTTPQIPSHTHANTVGETAHSHSTGQTGTNTGGNQGSSGGNVSGAGAAVTGNAIANVTITNVAAGGGVAHNNVQPTGITNFIIKF